MQEVSLILGRLQHLTASPALFMLLLLAIVRLSFTFAKKRIMESSIINNKAIIAALGFAIDEGDASPDVSGFDRDAFLKELMEESVISASAKQ